MEMLREHAVEIDFHYLNDSTGGLERLADVYAKYAHQTTKLIDSSEERITVRLSKETKPEYRILALIGSCDGTAFEIAKPYEQQFQFCYAGTETERQCEHTIFVDEHCDLEDVAWSLIVSYFFPMTISTELCDLISIIKPGKELFHFRIESNKESWKQYDHRLKAASNVDGRYLVIIRNSYNEGLYDKVALIEELDEKLLDVMANSELFYFFDPDHVNDPHGPIFFDIFISGK